MERTKAVVATYIRGIAVRTKLILLCIQIFFIFFYGYLIYKNFDRIHFLILYSCIALFSVFMIFFDVFHLEARTNKEADENKEIKTALRIILWILKACVIGVTTYQYINGELNDFSFLMLIVSIIALIAQIIIDAYSRYTIKHYLLLFAALSVDYDTTNSAIKTVFDVTSLNKIASEKLENRDNLYDELEEVNYEYHMFYLFNKINKKKHKISLGDNELKRRKIRKYFERNFKKAETIVEDFEKSRENVEKLIEYTCNKFNDFPDEYNEIEGLTIYPKKEIKVLLFFTENMIVKLYGDLSDIANKLILSTILYINDEKHQLINDKKENPLSDDILYIHTTISLILDELTAKEWREIDSSVDIDKIIINYNNVKIGVKNVIEIINKLKSEEKQDGIIKVFAKNAFEGAKKSAKNIIKDIKNKITNK